MILDQSLLKDNEKFAFALRALYASHGYRQFKMSKFEEYDLYMQNKDFLMSDGIITFNDTDGTLLALKPDVTLSIVKNTAVARDQVQKVYYHENVYRISETSHTYKEIMQSGVECIGDITLPQIAEVVSLANQSAALTGYGYCTVLSHIGLIRAFFADRGIDLTGNKAVSQAFFEKNRDALLACCTPSQCEALLALMQTYQTAHDASHALLPYCQSEVSRASLSEFVALWDAIFPEGVSAATVDFTVFDEIGYYSGIVFKCYIDGIARPVISGGQYDGLMQQLGRTSHAIGFAVYLDELEHADEHQGGELQTVNVALPKGRLGEKVYAMFEAAGYDCPAIKEQNRKLIFENREKRICFFWVKPSDVAIYVERGAADIGVAGYDILLEYKPDVYELCDLQLGKCRMAVAAKQDFTDDGEKTLRVATKFSNIARRYYAGIGRDIDIIHLNGSIELAPILGLSDVIVDIVETGKTLYENGLEPKADIVQISARLIANKASYRFKRDQIDAISTSIAKQVKEHD